MEENMVKKATQVIPNHLLRVARKERGWTQQQVADWIGAPLALNVTRWEGGRAFPSAHYVQKLSQLFEKSPRELGLVLPEGETSGEMSTPEGTIWQVPYRRNPYFTGRDEVLIELHQQLHSTHAAALNQSYAISGLGGIGKT